MQCLKQQPMKPMVIIHCHFARAFVQVSFVQSQCQVPPGSPGISLSLVHCYFDQWFQVFLENTGRKIHSKFLCVVKVFFLMGIWASHSFKSFLICLRYGTWVRGHEFPSQCFKLYLCFPDLNFFGGRVLKSNSILVHCYLF